MVERYETEGFQRDVRELRTREAQANERAARARELHDIARENYYRDFEERGLEYGRHGKLPETEYSEPWDEAWDEAQASQRDYKEVEKLVDTHYQTHQQDYIDDALHEAAARRIEVITPNDDNLAEVREYGVNVAPNISDEDISKLITMGEEVGVNYLRLAVRQSRSMTANRKLTPEDRRSITNEFMLRVQSNFEMRLAMHDKLPEKTIIQGTKTEDYALQLEELPILQERLTRLKLSPHLQEKFFNAWNSYSALAIEKYRHHEIVSEPLSADSIRKIIDMQVGTMTAEIRALERYADKYGENEVREVYENFGIRHFTRYSAKQLHKQLQTWQDGRVSYRTMTITASHDWTGGLLGEVEAISALTEPDEMILFEASSSTELARAIVAVGNRERANGRNPEADSTLEYLIINAHGKPNSLRLGSDYDGEITTGLYDDELADAQKLGKKRIHMNTYYRHLGSHFTTILYACETAGQQPRGKQNIAETMSDRHDMRVVASPLRTGRGIRIEPDGSIHFPIVEESSFSYLEGVTFDGRDGDKVKKDVPLKTRLAASTPMKFWRRLLRR